MTVALEARDTTLEEVLRHAASGDEVRLSQEGKVVARVKPEGIGLFTSPTEEQRKRSRAAMASIDERRKRLGLKFDFDEFKVDLEYGRK